MQTDPQHYSNPEAFRMALEDRIRNVAKSDNRGFNDLLKQVAFDRFLYRLFESEASPWILKGGYSMELAFRGARSTRDVDLILKGCSEVSAGIDMTGIVNRYAQRPVNDYFQFEVSKDSKPLENALYGGIRNHVVSKIGNRRFVEFKIDVCYADYSEQQETQRIVSRDWLGFAGVPPVQIISLSNENIFSEKLHAYTMPRKVENSRDRDLADMVFLIKEGCLDPAKLKASIETIFSRRDTHQIPKHLPQPPKHWEEQFSRTAAKYDMGLAVDEAYKALNAYLIDNGICERQSKSLGIRI